MARVYLVDDHVVVREALAALLEAHGHVVVGQAEDPTTAVAEVAAVGPEVLIVDLRLGLRSGFEVIAELQRRNLRVRTIVTTMSALPRDVAEALRLGVEGYLLKGSTGAELMLAIDTVLRGQRHYKGRVAELAELGQSPSDEQQLLDSLSARERQVVVMVVRGQSSAQIGQELHLSPKTVDSYRSRLMAKLEVQDVQGLVRLAVRTGLIEADER